MDEILDYLDRRFEEPAEVRTYDVYIADRPVRVEVKDHGASTGALRYSVYAYSPDIDADKRVMNSHGESLGNPDDNVQGALSNVHWVVFENRKD